MKNVNKFNVGSEGKSRQLPNYQKSATQKMQQMNAKSKLLPICVSMFVGAWILFSISHNNFLLDKVLMCSFIIICLLFFKSAEHQGDWKNNHSNNS